MSNQTIKRDVKYKYIDRIINEIHPKHYPYLLSLYMNDNTKMEMDKIIEQLKE